jgi:hypothetical protein
LSTCSERTTAKRKKRETPREIVERLHGPGVYERHERVQQHLKQLSDELKRRADEHRRSAGAG